MTRDAQAHMYNNVLGVTSLVTKWSFNA